MKNVIVEVDWDCDGYDPKECGLPSQIIMTEAPQDAETNEKWIERLSIEICEKYGFGMRELIVRSFSTPVMRVF